MLRASGRLLIGPVLIAVIGAGAGVIGAPAAAQAAGVAATIRVNGALAMRTGPSNSFPISGSLRDKAQVRISCVVSGRLTKGSIRATTTWDKLTNGRYVSHGYVLTSGTLRRCAGSDGVPVQENAPTVTTTPTAPGETPKRECVTNTLLVPSCGVLWGAAAGGFSSTPRDVALKEWERITGRTATIFHQYHRGDAKFPTKAEIAMTRDPAKPRVLLLNWKVAYGTTWAKVAAGRKDARINAWADYVKANYNDKFFLALHHEPENDVIARPGSGMTAKDYAAMYRHVITRLRAKGVHNAINVVAYMGNEKWMAKSWWKDIYPGDSYVDWIGLDSYLSAEKDYYHYGTFGDLLDRRPTGGGTSWYDWATTAHPSKPIMIAEWGVYHRSAFTTDKSPAFNSVAPELKNRPNIKAIVYFDTELDDKGDRNISVASTPAGLAAFRRLAADPMFDVELR